MAIIYLSSISPWEGRLAFRWRCQNSNSVRCEEHGRERDSAWLAWRKPRTWIACRWTNRWR